MIPGIVVGVCLALLVAVAFWTINNTRTQSADASQPATNPLATTVATAPAPALPTTPAVAPPVARVPAAAQTAAAPTLAPNTPNPAALTATASTPMAAAPTSATPTLTPATPTLTPTTPTITPAAGGATPTAASGPTTTPTLPAPAKTPTSSAPPERITPIATSTADPPRTPVAAARETGLISLGSDLLGASVYINGNYVGPTPIFKRSLPVGAITVQWKVDGRASDPIAFNIDSTTPIRVNYSFEKSQLVYW